ncbi:MAG TPA: DUF3159 domain-containing protein [Streptosporangiaceae bacterium]|jgi:hypothetical protein
MTGSSGSRGDEATASETSAADVEATLRDATDDAAADLVNGAGTPAAADPAPEAAAAEGEKASGAQERPTIPGTNRPIPQTLEEAFGGKKGVLDTGLPGMVFIAAYLISSQHMAVAVWSAVAVGAILTVIRLVRRDTVQHAIAGFVGVAVAAYIAAKTGEPANYYLMNLLLTIAYGVAFGISLLVRWPLLGAALGVVFGEGTAWRRDPARRRAYTLATALWFGMFLLRIVVLAPLWAADQLIALGIGRLVLGYPLYLLVIWLSWRVIKQTQPARPAPAAE